MACQHSSFIVAYSLEDKTRRRWRRVTNQSVGLSAVLCAVLGICGYLGFLERTQGDVLNNFPLDSMQADAARILLAFTMFFTYPMESFVARHVLIMLVHNGDMDAKGGFTLENESRVEGEELGEEGSGDEATVHTNHTNRTAGSNVIEGGGFFCMNRRQSWTMTVYLITLIPALLVSDIGPVLSLTGAVGGSCIAYIGPGLIFLGVNGEAFLSKIGDWVESWRRARGHSAGDNTNFDNNGNASVSERDLPVEGNASLEIPQDANNSIHSYESITVGSKPLWYYLGLFPLWCSIANSGAKHMKKKIDAAICLTPGRGSTSDSGEEGTKVLLPLPSKWDFCVSLFFILFGVISAVAGVTSNVYIQWNDLDAV